MDGEILEFWRRCCLIESSVLRVIYLGGSIGIEDLKTYGEKKNRRGDLLDVQPRPPKGGRYKVKRAGWKRAVRKSALSQPRVNFGREVALVGRLDYNARLGEQEGLCVRIWRKFRGMRRNRIGW
jgi:hypothetical protein